MSLYNSNKGQILNYLAVVIFIFAFAFLSILGYLMMDEMVDAFSTTSVYDSNLEKTGNAFLRNMQIFDYITVLLTVILIIGVGVTSFKLATTPVFFLVTVIMGAFMGFVSYFFSYLFVQMVSPAIFTTTLAFFPRTILIASNLHWVALVALVIGSIALYAKREKKVSLIQ